MRLFVSQPRPMDAPTPVPPGELVVGRETRLQELKDNPYFRWEWYPPSRAWSFAVDGIAFLLVAAAFYLDRPDLGLPGLLTLVLLANGESAPPWLIPGRKPNPDRGLLGGALDQWASLPEDPKCIEQVANGLWGRRCSQQGTLSFLLFCSAIVASGINARAIEDPLLGPLASGAVGAYLAFLVGWFAARYRNPYLALRAVRRRLVREASALLPEFEAPAFRPTANHSPRSRIVDALLWTMLLLTAAFLYGLTSWLELLTWDAALGLSFFLVPAASRIVARRLGRTKDSDYAALTDAVRATIRASRATARASLVLLALLGIAFGSVGSNVRADEPVAGESAHAVPPTVADQSAVAEALDALEELAGRPGAVADAFERATRTLEERRRAAEAELQSILRKLHDLETLRGGLPASGARAGDGPNGPDGRDGPNGAIPEDAGEADSGKGGPGEPLVDFDEEAFIARFASEVWPSIEPKGTSCGECHGPATKTPLEIPTEPREAFHRLLRHGYFEAENPSGLLAKVTVPGEEGRMPPKGYDAWGDALVGPLRAFADDLYRAREAARLHDGPPADETFPLELAAARLGPEELLARSVALIEAESAEAGARVLASNPSTPPADEPPADAAPAGAPPADPPSSPSPERPTQSGGGATFLSYHQLKRKIATLFADDWVREEKDLFHENIAQFGGADFQRFFSENSRPTTSYLAGLEALARDVVSKSFLNRTGPFDGFEGLPSILESGAPDDAWLVAWDAAVARLHERILLRPPAPDELAAAREFVRGVLEADAADRARRASAGGPPGETETFDVELELTVTGAGATPAEPGVSTHRSIAVGIRDETLGYFQEPLNQSGAVTPFLLRREIGEPVALSPGDRRARLAIDNTGTRGRVTFAGVDLVGPLPEETVTSIRVDHPDARVSGPWQFRPRGEFTVIDDDDANKGSCRAEVPLRVEREGTYRVFAKWTSPMGRRSKFAGTVGAPRVIVERIAPGPSRLLLPPMPERPPVGEARFTIDQTLDTIPHFDLRTAFRFAGPEHHVEISNAGTSRRVTADAVRFVERGTGRPFVMDDGEAEGLDAWPIFKDYPFRPYNIVGADARSDGNTRKGEIPIRWVPSKRTKDWKADAFYDLQVIAPGQEGNEREAPVIVRAAASSPVVRVAAPERAPVGALVELDASASYDVQGSELRYEWRQIRGPRVELRGADTARPSFVAALPSAEQRALEGLARALVMHPDFVFSRPPSLDDDPTPEARRRLLLTRAAQDLLARPPLPEELARLDAGAPLAELFDGYLASKEFEEFYYRRIRLYLESHGTPEEDEPARLWLKVVRDDLPFDEILVADYTVNEAGERVDRPAWHGRTGLLSMKGFIKGKPGLPHFNYAAQVAEKFLGYAFEVPPEIVEAREGITAASTTNPTTVCYSCHKVLTPLAYQRLEWDDEGRFRRHDERGVAIDASDRGLVPSYPFRGEGLEAFATSAARKERFIRTMIDLHFNFLFGRPMRWEGEEQFLYRRMWDAVHRDGRKVRALLREMMLSPEYLGAAWGQEAGIGAGSGPGNGSIVAGVGAE